MTYRGYVTVLFGGVGLATFGLLAAALWLDPLSGDLARLGGFAENQFGWTGNQIEYVPALAEPYKPASAYDVLVIGDSFSLRTSTGRQTNIGGFWTDHLAALSGASVGVGWAHKLPVDQYLGSASFRDNPPRFLVIEMVERGLASTLTAPPTGCRMAPERAVNPIKPHPVAAAARAIKRPTRQHLSASAIDAANDTIVKTVLRTLGFGNRTKVRPFYLTQSDLFTNSNADEILIYTDDFQKARWSETDLRRISCTMRSWQAAAEANGITQFFFLIAPDKTTIYRPYLRDPVALPDVIAILAERVGDAILRADLALGDAVAQGQRDVYLPNDTHWGSAGAQIAAELVAARISPPPTPPKSAHPSPGVKSPPR